MHRVIRPLFAPFYQAWLLAGLLLALSPGWPVWAIGDSSSSWAFANWVTSPYIWIVLSLNSIASARFYLWLRERRQREPVGPFAVYVFISLAYVEWSLATAYGSASIVGFETLFWFVLMFLVGSALTSLVWYPIGFVLEVILEPILRSDRTLNFGRMNARTS